MIQLDQQIQSDILLLLQQTYGEYNAAENAYTKYNKMYSIINMKITLGNRKIYRDLKLCIRHHLESLEEQEAGYDLIAIDKIIDFLSELTLVEQQGILKMFSRILDEYGYEEEKQDVEILLRRVQLKIDSQNLLSKFNPFHYASLASTQSAAVQLLLIVFFFTLEFLFLLPAYQKQYIAVYFQPGKYTEYNSLNTLLSIPIMLLSIDDDIKVKPLSWTGSVVLVITKVFFLVIILKFILKHIEERTKF